MCRAALPLGKKSLGALHTWPYSLLHSSLQLPFHLTALTWLLNKERVWSPSWTHMCLMLGPKGWKAASLIQCASPAGTQAWAKVVPALACRARSGSLPLESHACLSSGLPALHVSLWNAAAPEGRRPLLSVCRTTWGKYGPLGVRRW